MNILGNIFIVARMVPLKDVGPGTIHFPIEDMAIVPSVAEKSDEQWSYIGIKSCGVKKNDDELIRFALKNIGDPMVDTDGGKIPLTDYHTDKDSLFLCSSVTPGAGPVVAFNPDLLDSVCDILNSERLVISFQNEDGAIIMPYTSYNLKSLRSDIDTAMQIGAEILSPTLFYYRKGYTLPLPLKD